MADEGRYKKGKNEAMSESEPDWEYIGDPERPEEDKPLLLSDGDSIYSGTYGREFSNHEPRFLPLGTNAHIKYWKYAPKLPRKRVPVTGEVDE